MGRDACDIEKDQEMALSAVGVGKAKQRNMAWGLEHIQGKDIGMILVVGGYRKKKAAVILTEIHPQQLCFIQLTN